MVDKIEEIDIEFERKMIEAFGNYLQNHGYHMINDGDMNKKFMELNVKIREMVHDYLKGPMPNDPKEIGVSSIAAAYAFMAIGVMNAMDAMDMVKNPANNESLPKGFRELWAKVNSDWRSSVIVGVMSCMVMSLRQAQADRGELPLDMNVFPDIAN